ncbi:MAG TPA: RES family NAD+ phosphorylase, partial [Zoogloea sp.]|nr:RES family NAD+ phosphorylase [Zoogloea sp.]
MSFITWTPPALSSEARPWQASVWRMVEAQHIAATMKLVDSPAEQDLLESLLEGSKPPSPGSTAALDYLLAAPFRYTPLRGGSRFRSATDPGVFYGADTALTACAELGYWRWRFLQDAPALEYLEPVAHTAFRTRIATTAIDLRQPPLAKDAAAWTHPTDYTATQALAR